MRPLQTFTRQASRKANLSLVRNRMTQKDSKGDALIKVQNMLREQTREIERRSVCANAAKAAKYLSETNKKERSPSPT